MNKIPIIFCVDIEPDPRLLASNSIEPWKGFEAMHSYLTQMRPKLETATGSKVHYSWFCRLDPQIEEGYGTADWAFRYYKEFFQEYLRQGDEIGLHPHAYCRDEKGWIADHGNQVWVEYCLGVGFEGFQRNLGRPCRSFRFGDRFMNQETMEYLENAGVKYDLTLEPGYLSQKSMNPHIKSERASGSLPDTTRMPKIPYHPNPYDYQSPDAFRHGGLWVIPMSTGKLVPRWGRGEKILKTFLQPEQVKPKNMTLNLGFGVNHFAEVTRQLLEEEKIPYLAIVARVNVAIVENLRRNMEAHLEKIMNHPLRERFVFATPEEAMEILSNDGKRREVGSKKYEVRNGIESGSAR
jgi:hypothetical protein